VASLAVHRPAPRSMPSRDRCDSPLSALAHCHASGRRCRAALRCLPLTALSAVGKRVPVPTNILANRRIADTLRPRGLPETILLPTASASFTTSDDEIGHKAARLETWATSSVGLRAPDAR